MWTGIRSPVNLPCSHDCEERSDRRTVIWAGLADQVQTPSHESLQGFDFFRLAQAEGVRLRNERLRQLVLGFERPLGAGINVRVEVYRRRLDRLLVQRLETDAERAARLAALPFPPTCQRTAPSSNIDPPSRLKPGGNGEWCRVADATNRAASRLAGYTFSRTSREAHGYSFPFDFDRPHI